MPRTDQSWARGRLAGLLLAISVVGAGCGFTPLYATPGVSSALSQIDVVVPEGRVPYLLREDLDDVLAHDKSAPPAWRLEISVVQSRDPRGLSITDVAERYELGLKVSYSLTNVATGKVVYSSQVTTEVSYDSTVAPYAGIAARQNTQERAASDAARRIQIELAAWIAKNGDR